MDESASSAAETVGDTRANTRDLVVSYCELQMRCLGNYFEAGYGTFEHCVDQFEVPTRSRPHCEDTTRSFLTCLMSMECAASGVDCSFQYNAFYEACNQA